MRIVKKIISLHLSRSGEVAVIHTELEVQCLVLMSLEATIVKKI